jgi:MazG family protein
VLSRRKSKLNSRSKSRKQARGRKSSLIPITERDKTAGRWFAKLVALQARLYEPGGCPWDREQTHESLRKYLIEETYEVLDAMDSGDPRKFAGELGDLLLQVIFHSILAEESGRFTISDVIEAIHAKMIRRHPHVFADVDAKNSADVLKNWERIKAAERSAEALAAGNGSSPRLKLAAGAPNTKASQVFQNPESVLSGVPRSLPAVLEAYQLTRRASHVDFDWESLAGIFEKLAEEKREIEEEIAAEGARPVRPSRKVTGQSKNVTSHKKRGVANMRLEEEVGDLLFAGVNVARFLGVDPEIALKKANSKFKNRFSWMEEAARREGHLFSDLKRDRKEALWNESKRNM